MNEYRQMRIKRFAIWVSSIIILAACAAETAPTAPAPTVGIANPASVFCEERGYALEMREQAGGTAGFCLFPDGSSCEEWAFYRGECAPAGDSWGSEQLELVQLESFPIQVQAHVRGTLPDSCTNIARVEQAVDPPARTISLRLIVETTAATSCQMTPTSFEEIVNLEVQGLPAGNYRVLLGGLSADFTLPADNVAPAGSVDDTLPPETLAWPLVTNPTFGFSFRIPPGWIVTETTEQPHTLAGHQMQVTAPDAEAVVFTVAYKLTGDPLRITRSGLREGELISSGTINFLDAPVEKLRLEFAGKVVGIYYDSAGEVARDSLTFTLALDYRGDSQTGAGIAAETERLADLLVASFAVEVGP